jgi:acyl-CoA thioesterase FadM
LCDIRGASFRFEYEIKRGEELLVDGFTVHACTNAEGRARRMPPKFRELISRAL